MIHRLAPKNVIHALIWKHKTIKSLQSSLLYLTWSIDRGYVSSRVCRPMCALFFQTDTPTQERWTGRQTECPSTNAERTEMELEQLHYWSETTKIETACQLGTKSQTGSKDTAFENVSVCAYSAKKLAGGCCNVISFYFSFHTWFLSLFVTSIASLWFDVCNC